MSKEILFTVTDCRIAGNMLLVRLQTDEGELREALPVLGDIARTEEILTACGLDPDGITLGEIAQGLPRKQGKALYDADLGAIEHYLKEGKKHE